MESIETTEVNPASPAALRAAGITKLTDHKKIWKIPDISKMFRTVGTICAGGEKRPIRPPKNGNRADVIKTNAMLEPIRNERINFRASAMFFRPTHCPTSVTTQRQEAFPAICESWMMELAIALTAIA